MRVEIQERHREYDGYFKLDRVVLRYEELDGSMGDPVSRLLFERGDSVAVLMYDPQRDAVILVQQFRYPAYEREPGDGWLIEVVAGVVDRGRDPATVARTEAVEEAGYALDTLEYVATFYLSPGACSERLHLYLGYVSPPNRVSEGGGVEAEGENVRVLELPRSQALCMVQAGVIRDAKTIIALQYLALRVTENRERVSTLD